MTTNLSIYQKFISGKSKDDSHKLNSKSSGDNYSRTNYYLLSKLTLNEAARTDEEICQSKGGGKHPVSSRISCCPKE